MSAGVVGRDDDEIRSLQSTPSPEFSPLAFADEMLPVPTYKLAATSSIDIDGFLSPPIHLHEDLSNGCGGQTWPAGMILAKHMLRYHRDQLQSSRILELGAGGGLVGLAVAAGCSIDEPVLVTDQDTMFPLMLRNIALNGLQDKANAAVLNWGEPLDQQVVDLKPDVILAADCVYFEPAFPLLLDTLDRLFTLNPSATVYFSYKKRRHADRHFMAKARKAFQVTELFDDDRPIFSRQALFLYTFKRKCRPQ